MSIMVWRTNYGYFRERFGFSKRTAERSLGILDDMRLLKRTIRHAEFEGRTLPNSVIVELRVDKVRALPGMPAVDGAESAGSHHDKLAVSERRPKVHAEMGRPQFGTAPPEAIADFLDREYGRRRGRGVIPWPVLLDQDCPISFDAQKAQTAFAGGV